MTRNAILPIAALALTSAAAAVPPEAASTSKNKVTADCALNVPGVGRKQQEEICVAEVVILERKKKALMSDRHSDPASIQGIQNVIDFFREVIRDERLMLGEKVDPGPGLQIFHGLGPRTDAQTGNP